MQFLQIYSSGYDLAGIMFLGNVENVWTLDPLQVFIIVITVHSLWKSMARYKRAFPSWTKQVIFF